MGQDLRGLLSVEVPLLLAPFGPWEQVDLVAQAGESGGMAAG